MKPISKAVRAAKKIKKALPWAERCKAVHQWRKAVEEMLRG